MVARRRGPRQQNRRGCCRALAAERVADDAADVARASKTAAVACRALAAERVADDAADMARASKTAAVVHRAPPPAGRPRPRERRAGALFNERFAAWLESLE